MLHRSRCVVFLWCAWAALATSSIACGGADKTIAGDDPSDGSSVDVGQGGVDAGAETREDAPGDTRAADDAFGGTDSGPASDSAIATDTGDAGDPGDGSVKFSGAVYAHSSTTLYRLDPTTYDVILIGDFQDASGAAVVDMTDIALDKTGTMYGVTFNVLYKIDYKAAKPTCTQLATLSTSFNGLTVVPAGLIDPTSEVLVGSANDGGWWRIDVVGGASAKLTQLGSYGSGLASSGDAVGIIGDAVFASVTGLPGHDHIITVDPKTGAMKADLGDTGVDGLWGVGYWGGVMYGFASSGALYAIDLKTLKSTLIPLKTKPSGGWWGAGVVTSAPRGTIK